MRRRPLITALPGLAATALGAGAQAADTAPKKVLPNQAAQPLKVLRYAFRIAEAGFDPARISDIYSRAITAHIFEAPYQYDPLARPYKLRPNTAIGMPDHSDDFRTWTVKLKPGILFADDPAFKGRPRELVAQDYVYSFKRLADPASKCPMWAAMEGTGFSGLNELRQQAIRSKQPFDYDRPIEGLRALDRYTLQFRLDQPSPRFATAMLAANDLRGAVAREVVELYGDQIAAHPVGTGPFRLVQWRRSSFIVLERNPAYREVLYDAEPREGDSEGAAILAKLKGRRLPMIDRVEVSIVDESQPRWLSFLQQGSDMIEDVPVEFTDRAMPGGQVAPNLARQGVRGYRMVRADATYTYFNMDDPVVGGYAPQQVALRRAIGLCIDLEREVRLVRRGQAIVAQGPLLPHTSAYVPGLRTENGEFSIAKAKALLDLHGYVDRDGDGWRERPDGSPLLLKKSTVPTQSQRQLDEQWQRNLKAVGLRTEFLPAKFQENLKAARAGKLQIWSLAGSGDEPDSLDSLSNYDSAEIGGTNHAKFRLPEMDAIYRQLRAMPDGPERQALFDRAVRIAVAYMPYKWHVHRLITDMAHPWVIGYRRPVFWNEFWQYIDIDESQRPKG